MVLINITLFHEMKSTWGTTFQHKYPIEYDHIVRYAKDKYGNKNTIPVYELFDFFQDGFSKDNKLVYRIPYVK